MAADAILKTRKSDFSLDTDWTKRQMKWHLLLTLACNIMISTMF